MRFKRALGTGTLLTLLILASMFLWRALQPQIPREDMTATVLSVVCERAVQMQSQGQLPSGEVDAHSLPRIAGKMDRITDGWGRHVRIWNTADGIVARSAGLDGLWETADDIVVRRR